LDLNPADAYSLVAMQVLSAVLIGDSQDAQTVEIFLAPRKMEHFAAEFFDQAGVPVSFVALAVSLVLRCKDRIRLALLK
jgi:hypothetical protein